MSIHMVTSDGANPGLLSPFGDIDVAFALGRPSRRPCALFFDYWTASRHPGRAASGRSAEPADMIPLLPYTFLVERTGHGWRYKLFGSALVEQLGLDLTGRLVSDVFRPATADAMIHLFHSVAWRRAPVGIAGRWSHAGAQLEFESVQAPLAERDRCTTLLLGCFSVEDEAGCA